MSSLGVPWVSCQWSEGGSGSHAGAGGAGGGCGVILRSSPLNKMQKHNSPSKNSEKAVDNLGESLPSRERLSAGRRMEPRNLSEPHGKVVYSIQVYAEPTVYKRGHPPPGGGEGGASSNINKGVGAYRGRELGCPLSRTATYVGELVAPTPRQRLPCVRWAVSRLGRQLSRRNRWESVPASV